MNVLETAKQAEGYILDRRRYYHQHPELSGQEKNTSEQLVRDLEALGITEIHHMKNCYGLNCGDSRQQARASCWESAPI